jgi:hypothetical protein
VPRYVVAVCEDAGGVIQPGHTRGTVAPFSGLSEEGRFAGRPDANRRDRFLRVAESECRIRVKPQL